MKRIHNLKTEGKEKVTFKKYIEKVINLIFKETKQQLFHIFHIHFFYFF